MSVLTTPEKMDEAVLDRLSEEGRLPHRLRPVRREYEPLEEAFEYGEPPEDNTNVRVEAPDAGEPQFYHDDRELKHGRSRG